MRHCNSSHNSPDFLNNRHAGRSKQASTRQKKRGFDHEEALKKLKSRGQLTRAELLCCRVNYCTHGPVLGTKDFVESAFQSKRAWFAKTRKEGAITLPISDEDLVSLK